VNRNKNFKNKLTMKKSATILVTLFMTYSIAVHGQNDTWSGHSIIRDVNGTNRIKVEWISDDANRGILHVISLWENGQWKETEKTENRFDHYGNLVEVAVYDRDAIGNWIEAKNLSSGFNDNGNIKSITFKQRTPGQEWRIDVEEIYEYNENNEIIARHISEQTNKKSHYTFDYQYDERGNCIVQTVFDVINNILDIKTEYGYDAENNLISTQKYRWFDSWVEIHKSEYEYDINKNRIVDIYYTYLSWKKVWEEEQKNVYVYDDNNRVVKSSLFDWNIVERDWDTGRKSEYSYDEFGNVASLNRFRNSDYQREWALHETVTYSNANTRSSRNDKILVYLDAGSGSFIHISGAAGAKITVVDTKGHIHSVRGNARDFETISTLTLPDIVIVNVERNGTRLTRKIVK